MAEFASAIIGVVAFAAQTCDALQTIVATVKDAPSEYDDLIHQVSDFRNVLRKVLEEQKANRLRDGDLGTIISHAEHRLKEVASLVAKLQKDRGSAGPGNEGQRVSRLKWVLRSKNVIRIQASLERHKLSINNMLALATMYVTHVRGTRLLANNRSGNLSLRCGFKSRQSKRSSML